MLNCARNKWNEINISWLLPFLVKLRTFQQPHVHYYIVYLDPKLYHFIYLWIYEDCNKTRKKRELMLSIKIKLTGILFKI